MHADQAAVPCRASQHETEDLIMTRVHEASQTGCSSRGSLIAWANLMACAFLSPQKEGTYTGYYLGKANVVIDTLAAQEAFQSTA